MKTYNRPVTQVTECCPSFMLMQTVSGGGFKGIKTDTPLGYQIDIF